MGGRFVNRPPNRIPKFFFFLLTNVRKGGYNKANIFKGSEEKSRLRYPVREPRQVRVGTVKAAEHGLRAGFSIGRESRVRPLTRFELCI